MTEKLSDAEVRALLEPTGDDDSPLTSTTQTTKKNTPSGSDNADNEEDPRIAGLAELQKWADQPRNSTSSRPNTPQAAVSTSNRPRSPSSKKPELYTPTTGSGRSSEERAAATGISTSTSADAQAQPDTSNIPLTSTGGSWWGGLSAMASAAVKQAEAAVKEIQKNEEALKWAEQVRENYGALRGLGGEIRSRALPTFTNILHTLAPPISQHERLQIHITHDLVNYPSLDPIISQIFSRVMSQVEGGDLMVIQRGSESAQRRRNSNADVGDTGGTITASTGWNDGPWWRQEDAHRNLGIVNGLVEGTKLVRASAEAYGNEFFASKGGVEEAAKQATVVLNESNPVRSSDIFLAIQAIGHEATAEYFTSGPSATSESKEEPDVVEETQKPEALVSFAVYLYDPIHSIAFSALSQSFPQKWADWLDAKGARPQSSEDGEAAMVDLPEEILEIIKTGGVDPREWVAEWLEEIISLAVGVVAQRYVARRMGVGEGGIGRGKRKELVEASGGGEAARAL